MTNTVRKATATATKGTNVDPATSPERKAERKMVEKRRAAGESWAAIAKGSRSP